MHKLTNLGSQLPRFEKRGIVGSALTFMKNGHVITIKGGEKLGEVKVPINIKVTKVTAKLSVAYETSLGNSEPEKKETEIEIPMSVSVCSALFPEQDGASKSSNPL